MCTGSSAHITSNHGWIKHFQLTAALQKNPITKQCFDGVYPRDILNSIKKTPWMIIVNTDPSIKSGKHWILLYFDAWGACRNF